MLWTLAFAAALVGAMAPKVLLAVAERAFQGSSVTSNGVSPALAVAFALTVGLAEEYVPRVCRFWSGGDVRAAALGLLSVSSVLSSRELSPFTFVTAVL